VFYSEKFESSSFCSNSNDCICPKILLRKTITLLRIRLFFFQITKHATQTKTNTGRIAHQPFETFSTLIGSIILFSISPLGTKEVGAEEGIKEVGAEEGIKEVGAEEGIKEVGAGTKEVGAEEGIKEVGVGTKEVGVGTKEVGVGTKEVGVGTKEVGVGTKEVGVEEGMKDGGGVKRNRDLGDGVLFKRVFSFVVGFIFVLMFMFTKITSKQYKKKTKRKENTKNIVLIKHKHKMFSNTCDVVVAKFSILVYILVSLGFSIRLLVDHKVIDNIYFSHANSSNEILVTVEEPSILCLLAAVVYGFLAVLSITEKYEEHLSFLNHFTDGFFFSLLLPALVHLNDFLQIVLMFGTYVSFQLCVDDTFLSCEIDRPVNLSRKLQLVVLFGSFWICFFLGMYFNIKFNRPGGGVAQIFASMVFFKDLFAVQGFLRVERFSRKISENKSFVLSIRFILLVCVFVETV
jgi:uncharacterized integral membrane protein